MKFSKFSKFLIFSEIRGKKMELNLNQHNMFNITLDNENLTVTKLINARTYSIKAIIKDSGDALQKMSNLTSMSDEDFKMFSLIQTTKEL